LNCFRPQHHRLWRMHDQEFSVCHRINSARWKSCTAISKCRSLIPCSS
jgi:hypothetical protein